MPFSEGTGVRLFHGDCLEVLRGFADESGDACVTDPPAGISFMGRAWDGDRGGRTQWIVWMAERAREVLRVLKPGSHALVWALPRTSHWTATAWEDAGFEVRDRIAHHFGSGFPKSLDVSKAIDRAEGTVPATADAQAWDGWGTALKPSCEDWWLFRKPLSEPTVAANVLRWGTGALNVNGCRIHHNDTCRPMKAQKNGLHNPLCGQAGRHTPTLELKPEGRWPSNTLFSHLPECDDACVDGCPVAELDRQSGTLKTGRWPSVRNADKFRNTYFGFKGQTELSARAANEGGASRFFHCFQYQAKPSRRERDAGTSGGNQHPTVKSQALMEFLCRLITPPGGTVLDPFAGSGSTGLGALRCGFRFVGIEAETEFCELARARISQL